MCRHHRAMPSTHRWRRPGSICKIFAHPLEAVRGADLVTTDVWTSMGYEAENEARCKAFADWCVDADMMRVAGRDAVFMHCLPAHRGEEVAADVIDGAQSRRVGRGGESAARAEGVDGISYAGEECRLVGRTKCDSG